MDPVIRFLEDLSIWRWWGLAGALLVLELLTGTTYLLWPTTAALTVGLLALTPFVPWQAQIAIFAILTAALALAGDKVVGRRLRQARSDKPKLNERAAQLAGETVTAVADFVGGRGRVRLGDSVWAAEAEGRADVPAGATLEVVSVDGATLKVRAA